AGMSYKAIANCTLDSLRFAISTYSGLISMPTACRPRRSATSKVVPLPAKGSRTMHLPEPSLSGQEQVGCQPSSIRFEGLFLPRKTNPSGRLLSYGLPSPCPDSTSTILFHGAPHFGHALGDDPARIHSSGNFSGKVAKWPSGNGCVAMVQTVRLLLPKAPGANPLSLCAAAPFKP